MLARLKSNTTSEQAPSGQQLVVDAYTNLSELVTPAQVGYVLASLVLTAAKDLSGRFIRLKGEECESHREE